MLSDLYCCSKTSVNGQLVAYNGGFPEIIIACGENVVVPTHFLFLDIRAKEIDINLCLRNI